ncbi:MAG: ankyrin repeat domain-containing protein [Legionella sp.]|nr:ankyrin repeat domain-containing protein [Legionella sp.]
MFEKCLDVNPVKSAIEEDLIINNVHSPLTAAAASNDLKKMETMLPLLSEEELNWQGIFGNTALHWAVANTQNQIALNLLSNEKINVNIKDSLGQKTPLHLAIAKGWYHFNDEHSAPSAKMGITPSDEGPIATVIEALVKKSNVNCQDEEGNTPLHIAVMRGDLACVELLLLTGADTQIKNKQGKIAQELLQMDFKSVNNFLKGYAAVFTLEETVRMSTKDDINVLLNDYSIPEGHILREQNNQLLRSKISNRSTRLTDQRNTKRKNNLKPADLFEQSLDCLNLSFFHNQSQFQQPLIHNAAVCFAAEVKILKAEINKLLSQNKISKEGAQALANEVLILSNKMGSRLVTKDDVKAFQRSTASFKKHATLGKIIGVLIGAAWGVCFGLLAVASGVVGMSGAVVGGLIIGGLFGYSRGKKQAELRDPLAKMAEAAAREANILNPGS